MSSYTPVTNFLAKDALTSGNPLKALKGADLSTEFGAIQVAVNSKLDATSGLIAIVKTSDTSRSVTTQLADSDLIIASLAPGSYILECGLAVVVGTGSFAANWTFSGTAAYIPITGAVNANSNPTTVGSIGNFPGVIAANTNGSLGANPYIFTVTFPVVVTGAGAVGITWGTGTNSGTTTLKQGSYIRYQKIA